MLYLEEDMVVGGDGEVMGIEEAVLHEEAGASLALPVRRILHHPDRHVSVPKRLQDAAAAPQQQLQLRLNAGKVVTISL